MDVEGCRDAANRAGEFAAQKNYSGADPYDGLNAPFVRALPGRMGRQAWVQLNKRGGTWTRKIGRVPEVRMSKALALFAQGHQKLGNAATAEYLLDDLLAQTNGGPWGYEFDVQTRWAYYRRGTPNVVATAFALRALDSMDRISDVSRDTLTWIESLWDRRGYFHYTPASDRLIYNGNLLAAESSARMGGDAKRIQAAIDTTILAQEGDGSWPYGKGTGLAWKDSFHTVYVIDSLTYLRECGFQIGDSLERGIEHWLDNFFTDEGLPKYFIESQVPSSDIHNVATAVSALAKYAPVDLLPVLTRSAKHLQDFQSSDGGFRRSPTAPVFMRWDQGHAFLALTNVCQRSTFNHE